ncbi:hypothetical protein NMY22_g4502 [Coprinellus aureogranulatus]|nr:hypothetical protein NMY22_g4502 [Coprinellus aureogranulatus]
MDDEHPVRSHHQQETSRSTALEDGKLRDSGVQYGARYAEEGRRYRKGPRPKEERGVREQRARGSSRPRPARQHQEANEMGQAQHQDLPVAIADLTPQWSALPHRFPPASIHPQLEELTSEELDRNPIDFIQSVGLLA